MLYIFEDKPGKVRLEKLNEILDKGYRDIICHYEKFNSTDDFSFLDNAKAILFHDSFGSLTFRSDFEIEVKKRNICLIYFTGSPSDNSSTKQIYYVRDKTFYENLETFLNVYKVEDLLDPLILCYGKNYRYQKALEIADKIKLEINISPQSFYTNENILELVNELLDLIEQKPISLDALRKFQTSEQLKNRIAKRINDLRNDQ